MSTIATSLSSRITLNDGNLMPLFGVGTYLIDNAVVAEALKKGYRLIDSASLYGNEKEVGEAVRRSGLDRKDVFVVSKLDFINKCHGTQRTRDALDKSLNEMDIGYIDLYLIHSPCGGKILETYDVLVEYQKKGLIKSIGVSNFSVKHLRGLAEAGRPLPAVNQIELHCWYRNDETVRYCRDHDITVMGFSPLAKMEKADSPVVADIAKRCGKSLCQVLIRWSVQNGYITIPKTSNTQRLSENADVFDWSLSDEDMCALNNLEEHRVMPSWVTDVEWMP